MSEALLLERVRAAAAGARAALEASRRRLDDLNVYPVPDGDTGTNLSRTVAAVVAALDEAAPSPPSEPVWSPHPASETEPASRQTSAARRTRMLV